MQRLTLAAWLFASCCVLGCGPDEAVIGSTGEAVLADAAVAEPVTSATDAAGAPARAADSRTGASSNPACPEDCAALGDMCDPVLHSCVSCADDHCDHASTPSCDPQRFDCFRCRQSIDCPSSLPLCVQGECRRCPPGSERVPECGFRPRQCMGKPCGTDTPGGGQRP